jgi:hypothetical protein
MDEMRKERESSPRVSRGSPEMDELAGGGLGGHGIIVLVVP